MNTLLIPLPAHKKPLLICFPLVGGTEVMIPNILCQASYGNIVFI